MSDQLSDCAFVQELAGKFQEVVESYTADPRARSDSKDRLGRAAQRLRFDNPKP